MNEAKKDLLARVSADLDALLVEVNNVGWWKRRQAKRGILALEISRDRLQAAIVEEPTEPAEATMTLAEAEDIMGLGY